MKSKEIRAKAWESLKNGKYWMAFLVALIVTSLTSVATGTIIGAVLLTLPLSVGLAYYFLKNTNDKPEIGDLFAPFKANYANALLVMFIMEIKVCLWSMLFVIPGIIKAYEYAAIPYILAENPDMSSKDAHARSKEIMKGNKWRLFKLQFSFIGWFLLSILTCGVGIFFLQPYYCAALAEFYNEVK